MASVRSDLTAPLVQPSKCRARIKRWVTALGCSPRPTAHRAVQATTASKHPLCRSIAPLATTAQVTLAAPLGSFRAPLEHSTPRCSRRISAGAVLAKQDGTAQWRPWHRPKCIPHRLATTAPLVKRSHTLALVAPTSRNPTAAPSTREHAPRAPSDTTAAHPLPLGIKRAPRVRSAHWGRSIRTTALAGTTAQGMRLRPKSAQGVTTAHLSQRSLDYAGTVPTARQRPRSLCFAPMVTSAAMTRRRALTWKKLARAARLVPFPQTPCSASFVPLATFALVQRSLQHPQMKLWKRDTFAPLGTIARPGARLRLPARRVVSTMQQEAGRSARATPAQLVSTDPTWEARRAFGAELHPPLWRDLPVAIVLESTEASSQEMALAVVFQATSSTVMASDCPSLTAVCLASPLCTSAASPVNTAPKLAHALLAATTRRAPTAPMALEPLILQWVFARATPSLPHKKFVTRSA